MKVIRNRNVAFFDVDGTLVIHFSKLPPQDEHYIHVYDEIENRYIFLKPNNPMIRLLKEEISRGSQVVVWSRGGYHWAELILEALNLNSEDIIVMDKPIAYFDDKDASEWLTTRVFIGPDESYKNSNS